MSTSNKDKIYYYSIYYMILCGFYVASYGPLIPFYSKATEFDQTYFSFIFLVRSIANIFGGFVIKWLLKTFRIKAVITCLGIGFGIPLILCSLSVSTTNLIVTLFLASINVVMMNIVVISFNFINYDKDQAQKKIQILGFMFGVGAFLGPFLIMFLQLSSYKVLGVGALLVVPLFLNCNPPEISSQQGEHKQTNVISRKSELLICAMMLLYATLELGMGSWIPTYAIKAEVSDIQHSSIFSLLFWLPNCIFRLLWIYVPLDFHRKLRIIIQSVAITTFIGFCLQSLGYYKVVCFFGPITSGLLLSNVYAFLIALPSQSGYQFTAQNSANMVIANCVGEGVLLTPIGYTMNLLGFKSLMVIQSFFGIVMYSVYHKTVQSLAEGKGQTSITLIGNEKVAK